MATPPSTSASAPATMHRPPKRRNASNEQDRDDERAVLVAAARTLAVRYAVLMPKFKAVAFLQPEDHVAKSRIRHGLHRSSLSGQLFVSATHNGSIFAAGCVLFLGQEFALRRLEPKSRGEFSLALPLNTALSGGFGGILYSLIATGTAAWVGTKGESLLLSPDKRVRSWAFLRLALPYTLLRDFGGFALYFGAYAAVQSCARRLGVVTGRDENSSIGNAGSGDGSGGGDGSSGGGGDAISSGGSTAAATSNAAAASSAAVETTNKLCLLTATPGELARGVGVAAASRGMVYTRSMSYSQQRMRPPKAPSASGLPKDPWHGPRRELGESRLGAEGGSMIAASCCPLPQVSAFDPLLGPAAWLVSFPTSGARRLTRCTSARSAGATPTSRFGPCGASCRAQGEARL